MLLPTRPATGKGRARLCENRRLDFEVSLTSDRASLLMRQRVSAEGQVMYRRCCNRQWSCLFSASWASKLTTAGKTSSDS